MSQFRVGDTVRLKSGGPIMTICYLDEVVDDSSVKCGWFNGKGNLRTAILGEEVLVGAEPINPEKAAKELVKEMFSGIMSNLPLPGDVFPPSDPKDQS